MRALAFLVLGAAFAGATTASATIWTVNSDSTLRTALTSAANGDTINFTSNVTLSANNDLPAIVTGLAIDGNGFTLNANGNRGFFAYSGTSSISDLTITGAIATGGAGGGGFGGGAGGGGAGLGGGLFVAAAASVTTSNLQIASNEAIGGAGGSNSGFTGGGGGGGLGGAGGGSTASDEGGGGGGVGNIATGGAGGSGAAGIVTGAAAGGNAGFSGGNNGGGGGSSGGGCCGGGGGVGGGNGSFAGGNGGFGGGGGGVASGGGNGGFGGGGGGGYIGAGGNGGFGGGGGGIINATSGFGGFGGGLGGHPVGAAIVKYAGGGGGAGMGGGVFVQQGGTLILGSGGIGGNSAAGGSGGASAALFGTVENGGNGSAYGAGIFLQGNGALALAPAVGTSLTISDVIADQTGVGGTGGAWGVTMNGLGTVQLSAANAYSGGTTIASGRLEITGAGTLGATSGSLTISGGVLDLGGTTQTQNGGITLSGGTIQDGALLSAGTFGLQSGTVQTALTGTGAVSKTTAGTVTLSGANTYTGATTVNAGTLTGGAANAFSAVSPTTVDGGGTLDLGGLSLTQTINSVTLSSGTIQNGMLTSSGGITSNGGVVDGIGGTTSLAANSGVTTLKTTTGSNTYTGATTVNGGATLMSGAPNAFSDASATTVDAGGTLDLGGFDQTVRELAGAGVVTSTGGAATLTVNETASPGSIFAGAIKDGPGVGNTVSLDVNGFPLTLSNSGGNTYTGTTTIESSATLIGGANNAFSANSPTTVQGTLDLGGFAQKINTVTLNGGVIQNGQLNGAISGGGTINGIGGSASVDPTLNTTLEGLNSYTGATVVNEVRLTAGAPNAFSPNSAITVDPFGVLDLNGFDQTVSSLSGPPGGSLTPGIVTNNGTSAAILTNQGASSTFSGVIQNGASTIGLTQNSSGNTLTLAGANTYSGPTIIAAGTLLGVATNAFSAVSVTTVNAGGTLDLGGLSLTQTINSVTLAGGTIQNGVLTSSGGITSNGGVVDGIGGTTGLTVNSGVTTLKTTTGGNTYSGPTAVNGGTLLGGATDAFSAASATTVNAGGTLDLGGLSQRIDTVDLAGGVIRNGVLVSAGGITSSDGTLSGVSVLTLGQGAHALGVAGAGAQVNLAGGDVFTTQGAGAIGLYASLGGFISATGATLVRTSGAGAYGVNADGAGAQIRLKSAIVRTTGSGAFGLFASDAAASGGAGSISTTGTLNVSTANPAAAAIGLQGNGASIQATGGGKIVSAGDAIEFLGGTNQTATFDGFDISTQSGDIVFADPSTATITFNNSTLDAGTGYLLDAIGGSVITFNASASTLTGAMATDPASTSNVSFTNGAVWNLTGRSNVSSLAVTNSAIVFAPPGAGLGFKTLTVNNYVGSGANVVLNTALGGSSSPTDRIVVSGGSATGDTVLTIRNAGGVGGLTTGAGIPIVTTTNGGTTASDAFALSSTPVLNGFRYTLVDPGGDWYLVSSPTTTQAQVQNSINAVAKAQQNQIVTNRVLGSILLGATEQISCSSCGSGFGSIGSLGLGAHGRWSLSDQLTAMGGFSYNQWSSNGISVYDAPMFAGSLVYDFSNLGDSRPFIEAGGGLTPYEQVQYSRNYPNGYGTALGTAAAVNRALSAFARLGWLARISPTDEAAVYGDLGRSWMQTGGYSEATTGINPYPATVAPGLDTLNVARIGGQYTHLFNGAIEANVSAGIAYGFGAGSGSVVNVYDFGPIAPNTLPNTTWFEYGARIGYRASDSLVVDAFVIGTAGGAVGATAHGGIALRVAF